jgi:hypothetical protein
LVLLEDGVDGLGTSGDHRLELVPVDLLGDRARERAAMVSMGTPLSLMRDTKE